MLYKRKRISKFAITKYRFRSLKFQRPAAAPAGGRISRFSALQLCVSVSIISRPISNIHSCTYIHSRYIAILAPGATCKSSVAGYRRTVLLHQRRPRRRLSQSQSGAAPSSALCPRSQRTPRSLHATEPNESTPHNTDASMMPPSSRTRAAVASPPCWLLPPNPLQTRQSIPCRSYCPMDMGMHTQRRGKQGSSRIASLESWVSAPVYAYRSAHLQPKLGRAHVLCGHRAAAPHREASHAAAGLHR